MTAIYVDHLRTIFSGIDFDFDDKSGSNVDDLIENILEAKAAFVPLKEELSSILLAEYVREVWISESPPQGIVNTVEIVDDLVENEDNQPANIDEHTWKKLKNIYRAIRHVMSDEVTEADVLTEEFIRSVHRILAADGVIVDGGEYRTKSVRASGSSVMYCLPRLIPGRVLALLAFVKEMRDMAPIASMYRVSFMLRLATLYFSEFLLIHPFANGNGRTARILLSAFLKTEVSFPFSLYVLHREGYIEALEARNGLCPPSKLATYLLLACNKTSAQVRWLSMSS